MLKYKKLTDTAQPPTRGSPGAAGFDLFANIPDEILLKQGVPTKVSTGISMDIPRGWYGRVAPRSGLSLQGINIMAGVIDSDYRGDVTVVLINHSETEVSIKNGMKVAQIIIEKCWDGDLIEAVTLNNTQRGDGGFGSTGN